MKKKQQILATIISLIILSFFAEPSFAEVCENSYTIDSTDTSGDIAALSGCTEITGSLKIEDSSLTSLTGLNNLTSVGLSLDIYNNNALTTLSGLNNLTSVGGRLHIKNNYALTSLSELNNLTSLGDYLWIQSNHSLTSLSGLERLKNLTSVSGSLWITQNFSLTSLSGLNNLTSLGGNLWIESNPSLTSLSGLENLTRVEWGLFIDYNDALTNLCALYNLFLAGAKLEISHNEWLSMDTAYALETQLRSNGFTGYSVIYNNNGSGLVSCPTDGDTDNDGIPNSTDNCPNDFNAEQLDADSDSIGDVCDDTPGCGGCGDPVCEKSITDKVEELLTHYYEKILGRTPDPGGLNYWTGEILDIVFSGGDIKEGFISMAQAYFYSQEYLDSNTTDEEYVTDLYHTFFNRAPDSGGLAYWLDQLVCCLNRNEVLDFFVHSPEFNDFMDALFFGTS